MSPPPGVRRGEMSSPARPMQLLLAVVLLAGVLHLILGHHPWSHGVAKQLAKGRPIRPVDLWVSYGYWVVAVETVIVGVLLAKVRSWFDRDPAPVDPALEPPPRPSRLGVALVGAAVLAGVLAGIPRMGQSLWDDELYNVRRSIWGGYFHGPDGELEVREIELRDSFWYYRKPNNHVFHTLLARAALSVWAVVSDPPTRFVSEPVLRTPAMLAGAGSIAAVGWLLWRIGFGSAGVAASWLLALHPWHVRYLSEARGYSLTMALVSLTMGLLVVALHRGSWRRWAGYGIAQFLLLWTYPAALYHVAALNLVAAVYLLQRDRGRPVLRSQLRRWLFVNAAGAMTWLLLMTPNLIQFASYLDTNRGFDRVGLRWLQRFGSHLLAGVQVRVAHGGSPNPIYPELVDRPPALVVAVSVLAVAAMALGAWRLWRAGGLRAWLLLVLLAPGPLTWLQAHLRMDRTYPWYLIFVLPGVAMLVALGLTGLVRGRQARTVAVAATTGFLTLHQALALPTHLAQWKRPIFPLRESVAITRPVRDPLAPENRRIVTVGWVSDPVYYDPNFRWVDDLPELQRLMRRADRGEIDLFVNLGRLGMGRKRKPELTAFVEEDPRFRRIAVLPGLSPDRTRYVWRYEPGASRGAQ